jgi:hypothetical protein
MITKPTRVLCKRTLTSGGTFWWDDTVSPPVRHERDNRMLVAGEWYDVVDNPNDSWDEEKRQFTFSVIDNQGHRHLHYMYEQQDMANWPDICTKYGPRDYAKWFYTPEELILLEKGEFKLEEDIHIKPGNYHWVKTKEGSWMIAQCICRDELKYLKTTDGFHWKVIGSHSYRASLDFAEIGQEVPSQEKYQECQDKIAAHQELLDEVVVLIDAINKNDSDEDYPSVKDVIPFVNKAFDKYLDDSFKNLGKLFEN